MTKIKICGIKTLDDALAALDAGADMLGFNFYPKSPRYIDVGMCRNIMSMMRQHGRVTYVGVFVNAAIGEIFATMDTLGLNLAQLHGDEPPEILKALNGKAFKALRLSAESAETSVYPFLQSVPEFISPALLVDAAVKGVYGGSGVTADWSSAAELAQKYPLLLAGGLTPENVAEAIRQVRPWGVDVASGVEASPGEKDPGKMKVFVQAVRNGENQV